MNVRSDLAMAYHMGYDDALAKRMPDVGKAQILASGDLAAENAKLRELVRGFLYEHADYIAEGNYSIGDLDLEHAMHHNQAYFTREAKKLGVEVDE